MKLKDNGRYYISSDTEVEQIRYFMEAFNITHNTINKKLSKPPRYFSQFLNGKQGLEKEDSKKLYHILVPEVIGESNIDFLLIDDQKTMHPYTESKLEEKIEYFKENVLPNLKNGDAKKTDRFLNKMIKRYEKK